MEFKRMRIVAGCVMMVFAFSLFFPGCVMSQFKKTGGTAKSYTESENKKPPHKYYDFEDVLIPSELKVDIKSTAIIHTQGFSTGVLVLFGRVESSSLIDFFEINMNKDNWRLAGLFKSSRTIMLFQKENRWCVINITDEFRTNVEIWVSPKINTTETGILK